MKRTRWQTIFDVIFCIYGLVIIGFYLFSILPAIKTDEGVFYRLFLFLIIDLLVLILPGIALIGLALFRGKWNHYHPIAEIILALFILIAISFPLIIGLLS